MTPDHTPGDGELLAEALKLAEDVLSRSPFSTQPLWFTTTHPDGIHPNAVIAQIREALSAAKPGQPSPRWRPEIMTFADMMEAKLRANDHKPGWKGDDPESLLRRLAQEHDELGEAVRWHRNYDTADRGARLAPVHRAGVVGLEAADVANFAMMIADVCGSLDAWNRRAPTTPGEGNSPSISQSAATRDPIAPAAGEAEPSAPVCPTCGRVA